MNDDIKWIKFSEEKPKEYGKYLTKQENGKVKKEIWNCSGWAYNHDKIKFWQKYGTD